MTTMGSLLIASAWTGFRICFVNIFPLYYLLQYNGAGHPKALIIIQFSLRECMDIYQMKYFKLKSQTDSKAERNLNYGQNLD